MNHFDVIDGLKKMFDDTCMRQVVPHLIRNPILWDFLCDQENFDHVSKTLGQVQANWTISGVLEAAAGIRQMDDTQIYPNLNQNKRIVDCVKDETMVEELSAVALRVMDYIGDHSFAELLKEINNSTGGSNLYKWAGVLSIIFHNSSSPKDLLLSCAEKNIDGSLRFVSFLIHSDPSTSRILIENIDDFSNPENIAWVVKLTEQLFQLGSNRLGEELAKQFLDAYDIKKSGIPEYKSEFADLLNQIEINSYLIFLAQSAGNNELKIDLNAMGKTLISGLLNKTGISTYDPSMLESFTGSSNFGNKGLFSSSLRNSVQSARKFLTADPDTGRSFATQIYQEILNKIEQNPLNCDLSNADQHEILDLLITCGLVRECANLQDRFLEKDPGDIQLLRSSAIINHSHGNHEKAKDLFQLLDILDSLDRREKVAFAKSLEYCGKWADAFIVRKAINFLNIDDVKHKILCAYQGGLTEEIEKIIKQDPVGISHWPLINYLSGDVNPIDTTGSNEIEKIWASLPTIEDKTLLIDILEIRGQKSIAKVLIKEFYPRQRYFSSLLYKHIKYLDESNDKSAIDDILKNIETRSDIDQKEFENLVRLLIERGYEEKADFLLRKDGEKWVLSRDINFLQAKTSLLLGNYKTAKSLLEASFAKQVPNEDILVTYALALIQADITSFPLGFYRTNLSKIEEIKESFQIQSEYSDIILRIIGLELNEINRIERFKQELEKANHSGNKENWRFEAALANEYFENGQFDLAIQYYKKVERVHPFNKILLMNLLECYLRLKLAEEAEVNLHRLTAIEGLSPMDLVQVMSGIRVTDDWLNFLEKQSQKFPESWEINLFQTLSYLQIRRFDQAAKPARQFLLLSEGEAINHLIAAQLLAAAGDKLEAGRTLEVLFSNNNDLNEGHYLTAVLVYMNLGNTAKALSMLNNIQPLNKVLSSLKIELLLSSGKADEALKVLEGVKKDQAFDPSELLDLPLIDESLWDLISSDPAFFEKTAAKTWIFNRNSIAAGEALRKGLELSPTDEELGLLSLEFANLNNLKDFQEHLLASNEKINITSSDLLCSLGENALELGEEVLAAKYLSDCIRFGAEQPRIFALQARLQKRNGNENEAKEIYSDLLKTEAFSLKETKIQTGDLLRNQYWMVILAYEMGDFVKALEICEGEIEEFGLLPGLTNLFLQTLLSQLRQNMIFDILHASAHITKISVAHRSILSQLADQVSSEREEIPEILACKAYLDRNESNLKKILNSDPNKFDIHERIFSTIQFNGSEKTEIGFKTELKKQDELFFMATLLVESDPYDSLELIQSFINLSSGDPLHLALLSLIHYNLGNFSEAYAAITLALEIWPEEYGWQQFAGEISQKKGDLIAAISHFEKAAIGIQSLPNGEHLNVLHLLTNSEQAIPILEEDLSADPNNFELTIKLADLCMSHNKPGKAAAYFESARKLRPHDHGPLLGLGKLSLEIGNPNKALEYIDIGLKLKVNDIEMMRLKTDLINQMKDARSAREYLENQVLLQEDIRPNLQAMLADLIYEIEGLDECLEFLSSIPIFEAETVNLARTRVKFLLMAGDFNQAKTIAEKTYTYHPDLSGTNAMMGDLYHAQGDLDQSVGHYLRAINLEPSDENLFLSLFEIYNDRRDFQSARETLERGMMTIPSSATLALHLAKYLFQHGLVQKAKEKIDRALKLKPNDEEARFLKRLLDQNQSAFHSEMEIVAK